MTDPQPEPMSFTETLTHLMSASISLLQAAQTHTFPPLSADDHCILTAAIHAGTTLLDNPQPESIPVDADDLAMYKEASAVLAEHHDQLEQASTRLLDSALAVVLRIRQCRRPPLMQSSIEDLTSAINATGTLLHGDSFRFR